MPVPMMQIYKTNGMRILVWRLFSYGYKNYLRPRLPKTTRFIYAGMQVTTRRHLGDLRITPHLYMPPVLDSPMYEQKLIHCLRQEVRFGDTVVVIGGGVGVTSVVAAQQTGPNGKVLCYEGDKDGAKRVLETANINGVGDVVQIECAVVGSNVGVYGTNISSKTVSPTDLPSCDILEMDCEGSELEILNSMSIRPRAIAVESHGSYGCSSKAVAESLVGLGYQVVDLGPAEPERLEACLENDVMVLLGCFRKSA